METLEEAAVSGDCMHAVMKRKRTKRQRLLLRPSALPASTTFPLPSSPEPSPTITEEEEDMASCLILLARGHSLDPGPKPEAQQEDGSVANELYAGRRLTEALTTDNGKPGLDVYECKTCSKCFPSFQALGGHRASHKKPKTGAVPAPKVSVDEEEFQIRSNSFSKPIVLPANTCMKTKIHECSICRAEFASGQALGGHMRRHRPLTVPYAREAKKEHNFLSLDLNLPAPSDDDHGEFVRPVAEAFAFADKRPLLFSASALVDCHY